LVRHNRDGLVVLFRVFLGGVLVMLDGVQMVAVRDLGMMCSLFMIAGFVMFGGFAMMLGSVLMMLRGMLVVLVNVVIVHRSLSGLLGKAEALPRSMNLFRRRCVRSVPPPRYAARPAHVASCATLWRCRLHDIVPIAERALPIKPRRGIPGTIRPLAQPAEIRREREHEPERFSHGTGEMRDRGIDRNHRVQGGDHGGGIGEIAELRTGVMHVWRLCRAAKSASRTSCCRLTKVTSGRSSNGASVARLIERLRSLSCDCSPDHASPISGRRNGRRAR
jgi:hypothetical protein